MKIKKSQSKKKTESHLGYLLLSIVLIGLGLLLLLFPSKSAETIGYIIAAAALLFGLLNLVHTLSGLRRGIRYTFSLLGSVATIICAAVLFFTVEKTFAHFVSVIGLLLVIDASFKLQTVVLSHRYGKKAYWILLTVVFLAILGGFFCIRTAAASENVRLLSHLLALTLIVSGLGNLLSLFYLPSLRRYEREHLQGSSAEHQP